MNKPLIVELEHQTLFVHVEFKKGSYFAKTISEKNGNKAIIGISEISENTENKAIATSLRKALVFLNSTNDSAYNLVQKYEIFHGLELNNYKLINGFYQSPPLKNGNVIYFSLQGEYHIKTKCGNVIMCNTLYAAHIKIIAENVK